jgi:hypothetical protein
MLRGKASSHIELDPEDITKASLVLEGDWTCHNPECANKDVIVKHSSSDKNVSIKTDVKEFAGKVIEKHYDPDEGMILASKLSERAVNKIDKENK